MLRFPYMFALSLIGWAIGLSMALGCSSCLKKKRNFPTKKQTAEKPITKQTPVLIKEPPSLSPAKTTQKAEPHQLHWSYQGSLGPQRWGDLNDKYATCKMGKKQSPIDLKWARPTKSRKLNIYYKPSIQPQVISNGYTIQVNVDPGNILKVDNKTYELEQIHFHSQSEHTISGEHYPMEMHLVHKSKEGHLAVIARMLIVGSKPDSTITQIWSYLPSPKKKFHEMEALGYTIDLSALIPKTMTYYNYEGSLTTPPCTQGVDWNVFNTPLEISSEQLNIFRALYSNNHRPIQPLNERKLTNY